MKTPNISPAGHWGIDPNAVLVRALKDSSDRHVWWRVPNRRPALYLAAQGCAVRRSSPRKTQWSA